MTSKTMPDYPAMMIQAEIESGKATVRSLGALYMVAMASRSSSEGEPFKDFADINGAIMEYRCPNGTPAERALSLEPVKDVAWKLYEGVCHLQSAAKAQPASEAENLCDDCPRVGHSTDATRCIPCPRRAGAA